MKGKTLILSMGMTACGAPDPGGDSGLATVGSNDPELSMRVRSDERGDGDGTLESSESTAPSYETTAKEGWCLDDATIRFTTCLMEIDCGNAQVFSTTEDQPQDSCPSGAGCMCADWQSTLPCRDGRWAEPTPPVCDGSSWCQVYAGPTDSYSCGWQVVADSVVVSNSEGEAFPMAIEGQVDFLPLADDICACND